MSKRNDKILINIQSTRTEIDLQMSMSQLETCRKDEVCLLSLTWVHSQSSEPRLVSSLNLGVPHFPSDWQLPPNLHTSAPKSPILNTFLHTFPWKSIWPVAWEHALAVYARQRKRIIIPTYTMPAFVRMGLYLRQRRLRFNEYKSDDCRCGI